MTIVASINPSVGAALVAATIAVLGLWVNGYRSDRARRRALYAEALRPLNEYREYPYAVRRRRHDAPSEERARLQSALQAVQERITHHEDLLRLERRGHLYASYCALVRQTRIIAGRAISEQWNSDPVRDDAGMNFGKPFDYSEIDPYKDKFIEAVEADLKWWRVSRLTPKDTHFRRTPVTHPKATPTPANKDDQPS